MTQAETAACAPFTKLKQLWERLLGRTKQRQPVMGTTVYFGTNRNIVSVKPDGSVDFGSGFSVDGSPALRFGVATVPPGGTPRTKLISENLSPDPTEQKLGSQEVLSEMQQSGATATVVLIHGFNVAFEGSLKAAAELHDNLIAAAKPGTKINMAVFSWPSDGRVLLPGQFGPSAYVSDRWDAEASGPAFCRGVEVLVQHVQRQSQPDVPQCNQRVFLVAHSMGNYVLRHGLQRMIQTEREIRQVFHAVVLTAADEDDDAFDKPEKLALLPRLARRILVYFNPDDRALVVSDLKFKPSRLGNDGPLNPATLPRGVTSVAVDGVVSGAVQHSYHIQNPKVVKDIAVEFGLSDGPFSRRQVSDREFALV